MSATPKKRLCWNCDGSVPLHTEHCPYCGVYIEQMADSVEEEQEDVHAPPFAAAGTGQRDAGALAPPFALPRKGKASASKSAEAQAKTQIRPVGENRRVVFPLLLLLCGSVFTLFGLVLLLFSENGIFTLKWNGDHWILYLIGGFVLLGVGWRLLGRLDESLAD